MATPAPTRPFRWDVTHRARLGSLVADAPESLWFLNELERCAAQVLARCGDGRRLHFVGRSPDSVFDLLGGALAGTSWKDRIMRLPVSMYGEHDRREVLARPSLARQLEVNLAAAGLRPYDLQRGRGLVAFVDLVNEGGTYGNLHDFLRPWAGSTGAQWDVIRTKLRWIAITSRRPPSRHNLRWFQDAPWVEAVPRAAIVNVAIDVRVWNHLGNDQPKVEHAFPSWQWLDPGGPCREEHARVALATAVRLHELGRTEECRNRLVRHLAAEPTFGEPWLRSLAGELRQTSRHVRTPTREGRGRSVPAECRLR